MALRLLIIHLFAWLLPVSILLAAGSSLTLNFFEPFGGKLAWDLLRILIVIIATSSIFVLWKFLIQPLLNQFVVNPSQKRETIEWLMKNKPKFYDTSRSEFTWLLPFEQHTPEIITEIMGFLDKDVAKQEFRMAYNNTLLALGSTWNTLNLISYGWTSSSALPRTRELVGQLPNAFNCNVSRLSPQSELKSHAGESSCYIRCHMGVKIPAEAPITAMHVGDETRSWKEGKVMAFCDGHWHGAVNGADSERLVLIFDIMKPRLSWYTQQYCALMLAFNSTVLVLPGRFNMDEPVWRPGILAAYVGLATVGLPLFVAFYLHFKHSKKSRPAWSRRLRQSGFGFYY